MITVGNERLRSLTIGMGWPSISPGGVNRYVADLHAALPAAGVEDTFLALGPVPEIVQDVVVCAAESASLPTRLLSLARATYRRLNRTDVLASHFALYGGLSALLCRLRRVPVVVHFHGPWAGESAVQGGSSRSVMMKRRLEGLVYRLAQAIVVESPAFRDLLAAEHGIPLERIHVVTPGVDLDRFRPARCEERDGKGFTAFAARRLVPRMGLDLLIDAWPADKTARLVIAGAGPERQFLEQRAQGKNVQFLGRVSDEELRRWYASADLVVVPSVALEGFGLVVLESLACGTPVLASRLGGLTEVLPLVGDDLLVEPGDVTAWRTRLEKARRGALPDKALCREVAEQFGLDRFGAEVAGVYREAILGMCR